GPIWPGSTGRPPNGPRRPCRRPSSAATGPCSAASSASEHVAAGQPPDHRRDHDPKVEPDRPVLDIVQVEADAARRLLQRVDAAAHAVDLPPPGDAGLDAVARRVVADE